MAISLTPFERQFADFANAVRLKAKPLVSGAEGYQALEIVDAVYRSCRSGQPVGVGRGSNC
jgi:predicted dehydrogenase